MSISIITAVYNAGNFITFCYHSVIEQLENNDEWLIVDDASNDDSLSNLPNTQQIRLYRNLNNLKLPTSLNNLILKTKNKYIARMDADDICHPNRLKEQASFLDRNPTIGVVGTEAVIIDEKGKVKGRYKIVGSHDRIKWKMLFSNPLVHPSIMARAEILKSNTYNTSYPNSQDYELWSRLIFEKNIRFANIKKPLIYYRIHANSTTANRNLDKKKLSLEVSLKNIRRYYVANDQEIRIYSSFRLNDKISLADYYYLNLFYIKCYKLFIKKERIKRSMQIILFHDLIKSALFSAKMYLKNLL